MPTCLLTIAITLSLTSSAACVDESPAWLATCEALEPVTERPEACKEACGADQLCSGADQPTCELECRACAPAVAWCPEVSE